jgi:hypothetical protein
VTDRVRLTPVPPHPTSTGAAPHSQRSSSDTVTVDAALAMLSSTPKADHDRHHHVRWPERPSSTPLLISPGRPIATKPSWQFDPTAAHQSRAHALSNHYMFLHAHCKGAGVRLVDDQCLAVCPRGEADVSSTMCRNRFGRPHPKFNILMHVTEAIRQLRRNNPPPTRAAPHRHRPPRARTTSPQTINGWL